MVDQMSLEGSSRPHPHSKIVALTTLRIIDNRILFSIANKTSLKHSLTIFQKLKPK